MPVVCAGWRVVERWFSAVTAGRAVWSAFAALLLTVVLAVAVASAVGGDGPALSVPPTTSTTSTTVPPTTTSTTTSTSVPLPATTSTTTTTSAPPPPLSVDELCDVAVYLDALRPADSPEHWRACIVAAGEWPVVEVMAVMWKESGADSDAFNPVWPHASGLMQIAADNLFGTVFPDVPEVRAIRDSVSPDTYWEARDALFDPRVNLAVAFETWRFNGWASWSCKPDRRTAACGQSGWVSDG